MRKSQNKLKKHSVTKFFSDLSLFEWIVLVISNILKILGLEQFFLTVGQNSFGNKISFWKVKLEYYVQKIMGCWEWIGKNIVFKIFNLWKQLASAEGLCFHKLKKHCFKNKWILIKNFFQQIGRIFYTQLVLQDYILHLWSYDLSHWEQWILQKD